jgi:hypothetical protein
MTPAEILFVGGAERLQSVRIRCIDMARFLGCAYVTDVRTADQVPNGYRAYVCVKPVLDEAAIKILASRGPVIWDIIDHPPPRKYVECYLASSSFARDSFRHLGRVELTPHYHCNFEGTFNSGSSRRPVWVGSPHWLPPFAGFDFDVCDSTELERESVAAAYRGAGIGLNLRALRPGVRWHLALNSGIKLLNCLGFGIPSISCREPAHLEFGRGCTVFGSIDETAALVVRLQSEPAWYDDLRAAAQERASRFHINSIAGIYRELFAGM